MAQRYRPPAERRGEQHDVAGAQRKLSDLVLESRIEKVQPGQGRKLADSRTKWGAAKSDGQQGEEEAKRTVVCNGPHNTAKVFVADEPPMSAQERELTLDWIVFDPKVNTLSHFFEVFRAVLQY